LAAKVEYKESITKDLRKLDRRAALRLLSKIEKTLVDKKTHGKALTGEFAGLYSLRVGDYRVIYVPTSNGFLVLRIGHRREVYKHGRP
jgi:mRNA interferase RelE/StbE